MNTYAFDETGRCICTADSEVAFDDAAKVIVSPERHRPDDIWFDFDGDALRIKTALQCQVATNTISGLPASTVVEINGLEIQVDDGVFELEVSAPQTVRVGLRHVRHMHRFVEVPCEVQA